MGEALQEGSHTVALPRKWVTHPLEMHWRASHLLPLSIDGADLQRTHWWEPRGQSLRSVVSVQMTSLPQKSLREQLRPVSREGCWL